MNHLTPIDAEGTGIAITGGSDSDDCDPRVIAAVSNDIRYPNSNAAALPFVAADMRDDPSIYPPAPVRARLHVAATRSQEYSRAVNRAFTRIKTGQ